jgi:adenylylsulfate kinase
MPSKQRSFILWFTGLSGSGKSTLADAIYKRLRRKGLKVERLDGDTVRSVFPQTGFGTSARCESLDLQESTKLM